MSRIHALEARAAPLRWRNRIQTAVLIGGMLAIAAVLARMLLGGYWIPLLAGLVLFGMVSAPRLTPEWLMRLSGAVPIERHQAPRLFAVVEALSRRAELPRTPDLYWVPRGFLNAFAVGEPEHSAIAVSEGLLRTLTPREVTGVLAHEVSHVRSGDTQVMLLTEIVARLTGALATVGIVLAVLSIPLVLMGKAGFSWGVIFVLLGSPTLSVLLQMAISRSRERAADLDAARLTGDPRALASALRKIGRFQEGILESILHRHRHGPESPWLRSHPMTAERVKTLLALEGPRPPREVLSEPDLAELLRGLPVRSRRRYFVR